MKNSIYLILTLAITSLPVYLQAKTTAENIADFDQLMDLSEDIFPDVIYPRRVTTLLLDNEDPATKTIRPYDWAFRLYEKNDEGVPAFGGDDIAVGFNFIQEEVFITGIPFTEGFLLGNPSMKNLGSLIDLLSSFIKTQNEEAEQQVIKGCSYQFVPPEQVRNQALQNSPNIR